MVLRTRLLKISDCFIVCKNLVLGRHEDQNKYLISYQTVSKYSQQQFKYPTGILNLHNCHFQNTGLITLQC